MMIGSLVSASDGGSFPHGHAHMVIYSRLDGDLKLGRFLPDPPDSHSTEAPSCDERMVFGILCCDDTVA